MPVLPIAVVVAVTAAGVCVYTWRRQHHLRRVLIRERAAHRVTDAALHRDLAVFEARLTRAMDARRFDSAVLAEANRILDSALAAHYPNPQEGGPS